MPINYPIQNRKVAPASLAFETTNTSGSAFYKVGDPVDNVTYQEIVNIYEGDVFAQYITNQYIESNNDKMMKAVANAEHRAKHWVSDYKRTFQWDLNSNISYTFDTWNVVPYSNEVLACMGTLYTGSYLNSPNWRYICQDDAEGTWFVHAFHLIRFGNGTQVFEGRLGIFLNDTLFRTIDAVDRQMMGENNIRDLHLSGSTHIALRSGDKMDIRFLPKTGSGGESASLAPSSVYAYVTAHRENCDYNRTTNNPTTGNAYSFDHSTP